ncbi:hypothetical protein KKG16_00210, partial [Patescibacteria group bacterium]|nr:hypothetical protein [Patescibacteria group bacterium]
DAGCWYKYERVEVRNPESGMRLFDAAKFHIEGSLIAHKWLTDSGFRIPNPRKYNKFRSLDTFSPPFILAQHQTQLYNPPSYDS